MATVEEVSQKKIQVTLLGGVVLQPYEETLGGDIIPAKGGQRGDVVDLKLGFANMLIASNLALLGKHPEIAPYPNNKAERMWEADCDRCRRLGLPLPPHPDAKVEATRTKTK